MDDIIRKVRQELIDASDEKTKEVRNEVLQRRGHPLRGQVKGVRQIAKDNFAAIKNKSKSDIFKLCDGLWQSG